MRGDRPPVDTSSVVVIVESWSESIEYDTPYSYGLGGSRSIRMPCPDASCELRGRVLRVSPDTAPPPGYVEGYIRVWVLNV